MHILIFPSKIWAKKYVLYMAKYGSLLFVTQESPAFCQHSWNCSRKICVTSKGKSQTLLSSFNATVEKGHHQFYFLVKNMPNIRHIFCLTHLNIPYFMTSWLRFPCFSSLVMHLPQDPQLCLHGDSGWGLWSWRHLQPQNPFLMADKPLTGQPSHQQEGNWE